MKNKHQEIEPILGFNEIKLAKKFIEFGIPKKRALFLSFHFAEIEEWSLKFRKNLISLLGTKNKKQIENGIEEIWGELDNHIIKMHLIPVKNLIEKELFKEDFEEESEKEKISIDLPSDKIKLKLLSEMDIDVKTKRKLQKEAKNWIKYKKLHVKELHLDDGMYHKGEINFIKSFFFDEI